MSKVWPFVWVLSLDYNFEGIWGLSRWVFNFTEARSCPVGPYQGVCISSVDIGNHLVGNYQCKKGSRCVEITGFQVRVSSVRGARRFSSTRTLQYLSKFETMTGPCQNPQRPWSQKKNALVRNLASTSIDIEDCIYIWIYIRSYKFILHMWHTHVQTHILAFMMR